VKLPFRGNYPSNETVDVVMDRDQGCCVVCGKVLFGYRGREWSIHHRRAKGMGGTRRPDTNEPQNLISVCGGGNNSGCHGTIHRHPKDAVVMGWTIPKESTVDLETVHLALFARFDDVRGTRWVTLTSDGRYRELS
jgi:hypothetical protein